jgi:aminomethyltransferase
MSNPKVTPLKDEHLKAGAKMVDFAGWYMPVEYQGLRHEHAVVREKVGLFDVSHMGEIRLKGPKALASVEWLTTNEVSKLKAGQAQYTLFPNDKGGVVDDLIVYCVTPGTDYLLCVNASNTDKDLAWVIQNNRGAEIVNESSMWGQIAVQGPRAMDTVAKIFPGEPPAVFEFRNAKFSGSDVMIARTGYTGEDGVEIFVPAAKTAELWRQLLEAGAAYGVEPIGLGARDTLRTEMKYPLYGHELDDQTNPYAAGLGWVVKPNKKDFIGRSVILAAKEKGLKHKLIGYKMRERGIPRQGYKLFSNGLEVGYTTSGTLSPTLNDNIGIGYLSTDLASEGTAIQVEIRGRMVAAEVVKTPFVEVSR